WQMAQPGATGWLMPLVKYNFTMVQNIKRDPFEQAGGEDQKTSLALGGALAGPVPAYLYDWNMLPHGQRLALNILETYRRFRALHEATAYNLDQIMAAIRASGHPSD